MTTITPFLDRSQLSAHVWPNVIDGVEADGGGEETLRDSPAHDIRVASYRNASEADVDAAVTAAQTCLRHEWLAPNPRRGEGGTATPGGRTHRGRTGRAGPDRNPRVWQAHLPGQG